MKQCTLMVPKAAAALLGISVATVTRCVKRGAPVHRWGSTGRRYRIDPDEFRKWMERQGDREPAQLSHGCIDVDEMARRRRASVRAL